MKSKFIQLPPLPVDLPSEVVEMIWVYIRLSGQEQQMIQDFIRENLKENNQNLDEPDFVKILKDTDIEVNSKVNEFIELMRKMVGMLIAQSCEAAALIYKNYCIEKRSIEEISKEFHIDKEAVQVVTQYYKCLSV